VSLELNIDFSLIGRKVIVRSNEPEPYMVGILDRFDQIHGSKIPHIVDEEGNEFYCMGCIVPYSEPLARMLDELTPQEQVDVMYNISAFIKEMKTLDNRTRERWEAEKRKEREPVKRVSWWKRILGRNP
jgi:hypothetical protein